MNLKFAFSLAAVLSLQPAVNARLSFAAASMLVKATNDDRTLTAKYPFTNTGTEAVDILSLGSSCGCTIPTTDKMHFTPGESGVIAVTYTIGASEGPQVQTVSVITTEKTGNHYFLVFKAEIPRGLKAALPIVVPIAPRLLYWRKKPFETKTVTVDLSAMPAATLTAACDRADAFQIRTQKSAEKNEATIEVTPTDSASGEIRGELTLHLETANGKNSAYKVSLRIFPEKPPGAMSR